MAKILAALLALVWLGCGPGEPPPAQACSALKERWEGGGHLRVVDCRSVGGERDAPGSYAMQLELDLQVLADTQIFPSGTLVHKSGPQASGHQHPAGEVVSVREEVRLVEVEGGWVVAEP
jgi:hypothetical protein